MGVYLWEYDTRQTVAACWSPHRPPSPQACDAAYPTLHPSGVDYSTECHRQDIDPSLTYYVWELSRDGTTWSTVEETAFTSAHLQVLQTVYLKEGLYARCTVHANGNLWTSSRGYSRTSESAKLAGPEVPVCQRGPGLVASLTSYEGYSGKPEVCDVTTVITLYLADFATGGSTCVFNLESPTA